MLDVNVVRKDFPILEQTVYGKPLVYLDNAATTQKPQIVIDKLVEYYTQQNSNIHRGVHFLSEEASEKYEAVREQVCSFINAKSVEEIVFTSGTTDSINLVANCFGSTFLSEGDEVIISEMEHHSNIVPWQISCKKQGAILKVLPVDLNGELMINHLDDMITEKTKMIAITSVSNVLGVINPVNEIVKKAHSRGVKVLVDAAQSIQHSSVDVQELDCDFLAFSGHKMYASTGIGVLYGKRDLLEQPPPYRYGGGMIKNVSFDKTTYADLPFRFESGTANIAGVLSLGTAIEYLESLGLTNIVQHEQRLISYAKEKMGEINNLVFYGNVPNQCGAISFNLQGAHSYDVGMILDKLGIAVRTGMHCAEPLMNRLKIWGTVRASFGVYNTKEDINKLVSALERAQSMLC